jgi:type II secretory pathway pseudopilin PulG
MIELLFVMIIMAALAAIAIPSLNSGTDSAALTSMRSDAQAAYSAAQASYIDNLDFSALGEINSVNNFTDSDNDGLADTGGVNDDAKIGETRVVVSKGNTIVVSRETCDDETEGVYLDVSNNQIEGKEVKFDR